MKITLGQRMWYAAMQAFNRSALLWLTLYGCCSWKHFETDYIVLWSTSISHNSKYLSSHLWSAQLFECRSWNCSLQRWCWLPSVWLTSSWTDNSRGWLLQSVSEDTTKEHKWGLLKIFNIGITTYITLLSNSVFCVPPEGIPSASAGLQQNMHTCFCPLCTVRPSEGANYIKELRLPLRHWNARFSAKSAGGHTAPFGIGWQQSRFYMLRGDRWGFEKKFVINSDWRIFRHRSGTAGTCGGRAVAVTVGWQESSR